MTRRGRLALAVIVVIVGAALAIPRTSYQTTPETSPAGNPNRVEVAADLSAAPPSPAVTPIPAASAAETAPQAAVAEAPKPSAPKVAKNRAVSAPKSSARKSDVVAPVHAAGPQAVGLSASAEPAAAAPVLTATPAALVNVPPPVTITGCLEVSVNSDEFRLTDTEGLGAPKSRSWKTGFLKKHSAPVLLVEAGDAHSLEAQVGKRVAATGHLTNQELKVSSMRVVSSSCD